MRIVDGHQDIASTLLETGRDFGVSHPKRSLSLPGLKRGGVALVLATLFDLGPERRGKAPAAEEQMGVYRRLVERFPDELAWVRSLADLPGGDARDRIGLALLMEGAAPLPSPGALEAYHREGVRVLGLTWNHANAYAGGVSDPSQGLTAAGRELLGVMAELSVVLDVSHLNERSFSDVLGAWDGPIVASHSNARAVADHPRNLCDWQVRAIAERGGVVGLNFFRMFLVPPEEDRRPATAQDLVRHAEHIARIGGAGCPAVGTDLDGGFGPPDAVRECSRAEDLANLPGILSAAGFPSETVENICWKNWYRILGAALP